MGKPNPQRLAWLQKNRRPRPVEILHNPPFQVAFERLLDRFYLALSGEAGRGEYLNLTDVAKATGPNAEFEPAPFGFTYFEGRIPQEGMKVARLEILVRVVKVE